MKRTPQGSKTKAIPERKVIKSRARSVKSASQGSKKRSGKDACADQEAPGNTAQSSRDHPRPNHERRPAGIGGAARLIRQLEGRFATANPTADDRTAGLMSVGES
jgi:hypothetical protein